MKVFDGGEGTAREMKRRLMEAELLNEQQKKGRIDFRNSLLDEDKIALCQKLFAL